MKKGLKSKSGQMENILSKQLDKLITLTENSIIIDLALKGFSYHQIRKMIGGDYLRIVNFLKPINKEIKKFLRHK